MIDKKGAVQFALDIKTLSKPVWQSITITSLERSAAYSALTVIIGLSDDTETVLYSEELPTILIEELVGLFLKESTKSVDVN